jgi:hypothetical protein
MQSSTVILGATKPEQIIENLKALDVIKKITPEACRCLLFKAVVPLLTLLQVREKINKILDNDPTPEPNMRPL